MDLTFIGYIIIYVTAIMLELLEMNRVCSSVSKQVHVGDYTKLYQFIHHTKIYYYFKIDQTALCLHEDILTNIDIRLRRSVSIIFQYFL